MLSDQVFAIGIKRLGETFQYVPPGFQQAAWRAKLDEERVPDAVFGGGVKFICGSLKQWNRTNNLAALILEYQADVYRPQAQAAALEAQNQPWPKQLRAATLDGNALLAFHRAASAHFREQVDGGDPRRVGESVSDYTRRINAKFLTQCRLDGIAIPRPYAEAWA